MEDSRGKLIIASSVTTAMKTVEDWGFDTSGMRIFEAIINKRFRGGTIDETPVKQLRALIDSHEEYMNKSMEDGNEAHLMAERYLNEMAPHTPSSPRAKEFGKLLIDMMDKMPPFYAIMSEEVMGSNLHWFTGTIDAMVMFAEDGTIEVNGGTVEVKKGDFAFIDFKTGAPMVDVRPNKNPNRKPWVYDNKLRKVSKQIGGYSILVKENYEIPESATIHAFCLSAFEEEPYSFDEDGKKVYESPIRGSSIYYLPIIEQEEEDFLKILEQRREQTKIKKRDVYYKDIQK